jgi:hypothetical protein
MAASDHARRLKPRGTIIGPTRKLSFPSRAQTFPHPRSFLGRKLLRVGL